MKRKKKSSAFSALLLVLLLLVTAGIVYLRTGQRIDIAEKPPAAPAADTRPPAPTASVAPALPEKKEEPEEKIFLSNEDFTGQLRISELMGKNYATVADGEGKFLDYIELENSSGRVLELEGWYLSDKEGEALWAFPARQLQPDERLLLFCGGSDPMSPDFSISCGETVYLLSPSGQTISAVLCDTDEAGMAIQLGEDGVYRASYWATPGYPNTRQGYLDFCAASAAKGPVVINELMCANSLYAIQPGMEGEDWVELKNISQEPVDLSGWHLSDKRSDYSLWALPERILEPGETLLIYCSGDESLSTSRYIHACFSLDAVSEALFLTGSDGALADYVSYHDITRNGSMGRMDGENGFFFFATPTPGADNIGGARRVSALPRSLTAEGAHDGVQSLTVELAAEGKMHYTLDGTVPTTESPVYTGPISIDRTTVVRAISVEEGALVSRVATFSYMVNENHTLPILSVVVDDLSDFNFIYQNKRKYVEIPANAAFYDGDASFNHECSVSLKGWTSRDLPKKSLGLKFSGIYQGNLECDLFENGITTYSTLSVRAGQDYTFSIFRNELFQELNFEMDPEAYSQHSKYCILYINGEYRGIYCLKEDYSRQYYASRNGISKDSVTAMRLPVAVESDYFQEIVEYFRNHKLTSEANYQYICDRVDIDGLIDWCIIEGYAANTDMQGNARIFRSPETGNKWQFAAYDFDWGFYYSGSDFTNIFHYYNFNNSGNQIPPLIVKLMENPDFRARFLTRFAELNKTVLSNEHVLEKIDEYVALLEPEVPRDRQRWGLKLESWYSRVDELRAFITDNDWAAHNLKQLRTLLTISKAEMDEYFS